jgi:hypothetical protein
MKQGIENIYKAIMRLKKISRSGAYATTYIEEFIEAENKVIDAIKKWAEDEKLDIDFDKIEKEVRAKKENIS